MPIRDRSLPSREFITSFQRIAPHRARPLHVHRSSFFPAKDGRPAVDPGDSIPIMCLE
jgi:hypothetical protein